MGRCEVEYRCDCGETDIDKFYKTVKNRCKVCNNKNRNDYRRKRKSDNRKYIQEYIGGKCSKCGYSKSKKALEVHHLDPSTKDDKFVFIESWSKKRIREELDGCILLCANCHRELHDPYCE